MSKTSHDVICDAGPLIHLDELDCLNLLNDFKAVFVPDQVWHEVERHRPNALEHPGVELQKVSVVISDDASFQALVQALYEPFAASSVPWPKYWLSCTACQRGPVFTFALAYYETSSRSLRIRRMR